MLGTCRCCVMASCRGQCLCCYMKETKRKCIPTMHESHQTSFGDIVGGSTTLSASTSQVGSDGLLLPRCSASWLAHCAGTFSNTSWMCAGPDEATQPSYAQVGNSFGCRCSLVAWCVYHAAMSFVNLACNNSQLVPGSRSPVIGPPPCPPTVSRAMLSSCRSRLSPSEPQAWPQTCLSRPSSHHPGCSPSRSGSQSRSQTWHAPCTAAPYPWPAPRG